MKNSKCGRVSIWMERHPIQAKFIGLGAIVLVIISVLWIDYKIGNSLNPFEPRSWGQVKKSLSQ